MYIYVREDGKRFIKVDNVYSADIISVDGETDTVKWYGSDSLGELYVSLTKGFGYHRINEE